MQSLQMGRPGDGYQMQNGIWVNAPNVPIIPLTALGLGQTIGEVFEVGAFGTARLVLDVTAKSGTNPTLDVSLQSSFDGVTGWRTHGGALPGAAPVQTFRQLTDVGFAMSAVTAAGTTPPTITLTGTANQYVNLRVECTTGGALATWVLRYSIDGGISWVQENVASAATVAVGTTGLTLNIAAGTAATDNVWTAKVLGHERLVVAGLNRFVRAVARVGGSATPIMTAKLVAEFTR